MVNMTANRKERARRPCDFPYLVIVRGAGAMAKEESLKGSLKAAKGEKRLKRTANPSGTTSTTSTASAASSLLSQGPICDYRTSLFLGSDFVFGFPSTSSPTSTLSTGRSRRRRSQSTSSRLSIRAKAKRCWYLWCLSTRSPMLKTFRAPSPIQQQHHHHHHHHRHHRHNQHQQQHQTPHQYPRRRTSQHFATGPLVTDSCNIGHYPIDVSKNHLQSCNRTFEIQPLLESLHLKRIIEKLESDDKDRQRLHGLVECAEEFKQKKQNRKCKCIDITSLGHGSWNCAYRLTFSNGDTMAALVSNYEPKSFCRKMKESEISTMQYLHSTPRYNKHIKVPEVYDWDLTHDNKAGAPYIFREVIEGRDLSKEFDSLSEAQKLKVTTAIARVHKVLSQPAEFKGIGGLYGSPESGFRTGGYPASWSGAISYSNLRELWQEKMDNNKSIKAHSESSQKLIENNKTQLKRLAENIYTLPGKLSRLCIQHFDLAIRNVVFDDNFEITGVIDWEFAQVVPLAIAARIPLEFKNDLRLCKAYKDAFTDIETGTCHEDFEQSRIYVDFHDAIMGPDHAAVQRYVAYFIEDIDKCFEQPQQRTFRDKARDNQLFLELPPQLRQLRKLTGEGPESPGSACM